MNSHYMVSAENKKTTVKLKGVGDGFMVTLDPSLPESELKERLGKLFERMNRLSKGAKVKIDCGGADCDGLIQRLGDFLKSGFGVGEVHAMGENTGRVKQSSTGDKKKEPVNGGAMLMSGRVRSGQKVTTAGHLVIMGDVNPGGEIVAGGDILVMGALLGTAIAGQGGNEKSVVIALDFRPTQIQIGGVVAAGGASSPGGKVEFASVENGAIVVDDYVKANPFGKMPVLALREVQRQQLPE